MNECIEIKELLPIEHYVNEILSGRCYHNGVPNEYEDDLKIIHAEVAAGVRIFGNRGYDVIRNCFFISQILKVNWYKDEIKEKERTVTFDTFDRYYEYLNGDVYNNAVYYKYRFSEDEVSRYCLDLSLFSKSAFVQDTIQKRSKEMDIEDNKTVAKLKRDRKRIVKWKNKFCACENYYSLSAVASKIDLDYQYHCYHWSFFLSSFIQSNPEENLPRAIQFLANTSIIKDEKYLTMLCMKYQSLYDDDYYEFFDQYYWKRKDRVAANIKSIESGELKKIVKKGYKIEYGAFYIIEQIYDPYASYLESPIKAEMATYFEQFDEFADALDYDLSDCLLQDADLRKSDIANCRINERTLLPKGIAVPYEYSILKKYDYKKDIFIVEERWHTKNKAAELKHRTYEFTYFFDFVAFLCGNLSKADLVTCDGIENIEDFSDLNLTGAKLCSKIKKRLGIISIEEALELKQPMLFDQIMMNEALPNESEVSIHQCVFSCESYQLKKIYYLSDLHLDQKVLLAKCISKEDISAVIRKYAIDISRSLYFGDILIVVGDTACALDYFKFFIRCLRQSTTARIVFVLGNHEFWELENQSVAEIISAYKAILEAERICLLHNNLLYAIDKYSRFMEITEQEMMLYDSMTIRKKLLNASIVLFGGVAFAGLNKDFNADNGIYNFVVSRNEEIVESLKFERLYMKIRDALPDREVIVATHMPLADWSRDAEPHSGYIYLSGHTHKNEFYDDGDKRIYADNQVGYNRKHAFPKSFFIEGTFDPFVDYVDGIYEIKRSDYEEFYRGKNMRMDFNRAYECLYMLKREGYYCFIVQTSSGKLSILNGGAMKNIKNKTIESCYEEMDRIIDSIKTPLDTFTSIQKQIADFVKKIGGEGRIHGAIIDIDYYNHIYVNPNDLKITGYFATNIVQKRIYGSIQGLLEAHRPDLLPAYNKYLVGESTTALIIAQNADHRFVSQDYYSTDIYRNSNVLKKMQRLYSNILTVWPDSNQNLVKAKEIMTTKAKNK